jgi:hypothetical protein
VFLQRGKQHLCRRSLYITGGSSSISPPGKLRDLNSKLPALLSILERKALAYPRKLLAHPPKISYTMPGKDDSVCPCVQGHIVETCSACHGSTQRWGLFPDKRIVNGRPDNTYRLGGTVCATCKGSFVEAVKCQQHSASGTVATTSTFATGTSS